jgi:hypothetical protein
MPRYEAHDGDPDPAAAPPRTRGADEPLARVAGVLGSAEARLRLDLADAFPDVV